MPRSSYLLGPVIVAFAQAIGASASGQVPRNDLGTPPINIPGVPTDRSCSERSFDGRVAKRVFDNGGLKITGFVLEEEDGARMFINVYIPDELSRVDLGNLISGLQRVLKEGRAVSGKTQACGSGPVLTLKRVW